MAVGLGELLLLFVVCAVPVASLLGLFFILRATLQRKGALGVNVKPTACPQCRRPLPPLRLPKNPRQALEGGWTCEGCGLELDKWGRPVTSAS